MESFRLKTTAQECFDSRWRGLDASPRCAGKHAVAPVQKSLREK
jgi:hypothetical protein